MYDKISNSMGFIGSRIYLKSPITIFGSRSRPFPAAIRTYFDFEPEVGDSFWRHFDHQLILLKNLFLAKKVERKVAY
jgi:hypothetical protein